MRNDPPNGRNMADNAEPLEPERKKTTLIFQHTSEDEKGRINNWALSFGKSCQRVEKLRFKITSHLVAIFPMISTRETVAPKSNYYSVAIKASVASNWMPA